MHRNRQLITTALGLGFLVAATHAAATPITNFTTTYSTWASPSYITGSATDLNMNIGSSGYSTAAGFATGGFDFTGLDSGSYYLRSILYHASLNGRSLDLEVLEGGPDTGSYINVATPAAGENAMLLYLTTNGSTPITATLSDGEHFTFNTASNVFGVIGFASSAPMTTITLSTTTGSQVLIADMLYGTSALPQDQGGGSTPETATVALVGGGLLMLFGSRRKVLSKLAA